MNCPFCGALEDSVVYASGREWIRCRNCDATGPGGDSPETARTLWEGRAKPLASSPAREIRSGRALYEEIQRKAEAQAMDLYIKTVLAEALNKVANELHKEVVAYVNVIKAEIETEIKEKE